MNIDKIIRLAKADLAAMKNLPLDKIAVIKAEAVDWPDASLGCPQKDKMYARLLTPGYRLVLSHELTEFEYHTDSHERLIYCPVKNKTNGGAG